jgi:CheY-like chemotaxis protein
MNVLLVDDEPSLLELLSTFCDDLGVHNKKAINGYEAFQIFKEDKNFDAIISDFNMPVMNGLELLLKINSEFKECPPFVMISGNISQIEKSKHNKMFYSLLQKPANLLVIEKILREIKLA